MSQEASGEGSLPLTASESATGALCARCGTPMEPHPGKVYFSDRCRLLEWAHRQETHQRRLEFAPTASVEENHRQSQRRAVLAALRLGPQTALTLFPIAGPGFSSRLAELRKEGHPIVTRWMAAMASTRLRAKPARFRVEFSSLYYHPSSFPCLNPYPICTYELRKMSSNVRSVHLDI